MVEETRGKTSLKKIKKSKGTANLYSQINWEKVAKLFQQIPPVTSGQSSYPSVKKLLHLVAAAGAVGLVFAFPGAAPALGTLVLGGQSFSRWKTKQVVSQMERRKLVSIKYHEDGRISVKITKKGMRRALTYQLDNLRIKKPKKWDGRWRVIIFDIPNKYKKARDIFRDRLQQLSLYQLQESVYVSPYPCFDEIEFLRELYGVAFTVKYLLAEKIEDDKELKEHFELE